MHNRKMIAPVIITAVLVIYYIAYFTLVITQLDGLMRILLGVVPLFLAGVMIKVCFERIDEIKKGEDNDLSQY